MIDVFSRFSRAKMISDKRPETIIDAFVSEWVSIFGVHETTLSDNGRQFNNGNFRSMAEINGFIIKTTAAETHGRTAVVRGITRF